MGYELLKDIFLVLGLAVIVVYIFHRLKLPLVFGFLLTGVLAGPFGLRLIENYHDVELIAEIGVVLLLFTIGIEFSLGNLIRIRKIMLMGGGFQVIVTVTVISLIAFRFGNAWNESIFIGFLVALSSTAIVLKMLQDKGEIDTLHGRTSLGILIFQDLAIVPMMLLVPVLAGSTAQAGGAFLSITLKFLGVILLVFLGSKYIIPKLLFQVARTQSRELFLLSIILIAFGIAFLTQSIGLSMALGAFLAGLIISESDYSQQALGNILPFLHVFTSFFFISIGMLLDVGYFMEHPLSIILFTTLVLTVKTMLASAAGLVLGYPLRASIVTGFILSQVGEFSFILSGIGLSSGLLSESNYQLFLSVSVLSMAATPFVVLFAKRASIWIEKLPLPEKIKTGFANVPISTMGSVSGHLIIIGYGVNGRNLARAAKFADIPYIIIEINPETVRKERAAGEIIYYGDASDPVVLEHASVKNARVLVVTIPGTSAEASIARSARNMNPGLHIIMRARFVQDIATLYDAGADEVIPEEFETSVEIFKRSLGHYNVPKEKIESLVAEIRADGYRLFRPQAPLPEEEILTD